MCELVVQGWVRASAPTGHGGRPEQGRRAHREGHGDESVLPAPHLFT